MAPARCKPPNLPEARHAPNLPTRPAAGPAAVLATVDRVTSADSTNMFSDLLEPPHLVQMAAEDAWRPELCVSRRQASPVPPRALPEPMTWPLSPPFSAMASSTPASPPGWRD